MGYTQITPEQIDGGSMDHCGPVKLSISQHSFTCDDAGINMEVLTVSDLCGNTTT
jgi:hypothetical protein